MPYTACCSVDDAMLYQHPSDHVLRSLAWSETLPPAQRPTLVQVDSLAAAQEAKAIWKFATSDAEVGKLQTFAEAVELELACECSWHDQVDIAQRSNSKGRQLEQWVSAHGLTMDQVVAFGDNYNDLSMLERADVVIGD